MRYVQDFRYTTKSGNSRFDKIRDEVLQHRGGSWDQFEKISEKEFPGLRTRAAAFAPGGFLAERFSRFPIAAVIHGTLFVHGGIQLSNRLSKSQDELPLRTLNRRVASWLKGDESVPPEELFGRESPIWTRRFSTPAGVDLSDEVNQELDEVSSGEGSLSNYNLIPCYYYCCCCYPFHSREPFIQVLQILKVERMVVGHTPQVFFSSSSVCVCVCLMKTQTSAPGNKCRWRKQSVPN